MYFYFLSEFPAVVKFRGVYYGRIGEFSKYCNIAPPFPLIEILTLSDEGKNFTFFPTEEFLSSPPKNLSVTDLKGGYLLRFSKLSFSGDFRVLCQKKFSDAIITVFFDGGYKLSLETGGGFFADSLDFAPKNIEITQGKNANAGLIFCEFTTEKGNILCVLNAITPCLLLKTEYDRLDFNERGFSVSIRYKDIAKHCVTRVYRFNGENLSENISDRIIEYGENFDKTSLVPAIIPYAFAEELIVGGDISDYLSETVKENADKLGDYLGDFIGVSPPPFFRDQAEVGLVYKRKERFYQVDYFTFTVENGKISNIVKV